jgi:hypothetical protein
MREARSMGVMIIRRAVAFSSSEDVLELNIVRKVERISLRMLGDASSASSIDRNCCS